MSDDDGSTHVEVGNTVVFISGPDVWTAVTPKAARRLAAELVKAADQIEGLDSVSGYDS